MTCPQLAAFGGGQEGPSGWVASERKPAGERESACRCTRENAVCQPRPRPWNGEEQPGGGVECLRTWCLGGEVSPDSGRGRGCFASLLLPQSL